MGKINILFIITKLELGGAQKQLLRFIAGIDRAKYNLFLFSAKQGLLVSDAQNAEGVNFYASRFLERRIHPFRDFFAICEIISFIKKNNIQLVHTHSSKAGIIGRIAAKLCGVRVILHTVHGWSFNDCQNPILRAIFVFLERVCASFSDRIIVVSRYDLETGLRRRIAKEDKFCLIRYGINDGDFIRKEPGIRRELGIEEDDFVIGMVGCLKPQKSPQDFIRAAQRISQEFPRTKFILVGDGILRDKIERLIKGLGLEGSVILTGWRRDIPRILSGLDVFVLTSLWEGLPIAVLEAMAASLPVVVTDTGGIREAGLDGQSGFLVSRGDIVQLSEKVLCILRDRQLRQSMGQAARGCLGDNFCFPRMIQGTESLYANLTQKKKAHYVS